MSSIQERLQMKRVPIDKWSIREQLCLASAVACSGDQNWMSVSRSLKVMCGNDRPSDWFSQKSCAAQYGKLLESVETPKRKKRTSEKDSPMSVETPVEIILRRLKQERIAELNRLIEDDRKEYNRIKDSITLVQSENVTEAQLREFWQQIEVEKKQEEKEQQLHAQWLKEREERKIEMERAWRPISLNLYQQQHQQQQQSSLSTGQSPSKSGQLNIKIKQEDPDPDDYSARQGTSPLLTSLLKSPSPAPNPILHTSLSGPPPTATRVSAPTITNLLTGSVSNISTNLSSSAHYTAQLQKQPLTGPAPIIISDNSIQQSPSQAAPTLSMLLENKQKESHQKMPPLVRIDSHGSLQQSIRQSHEQSHMVNVQNQLTGQSTKNNFLEISSTTKNDPIDSPIKDEDQHLMEVFNGLIPDNIDELANILTENNAIILNPDMLAEDEILENVDELMGDDEDEDVQDDVSQLLPSSSFSTIENNVETKPSQPMIPTIFGSEVGVVSDAEKIEKDNEVQLSPSGDTQSSSVDPVLIRDDDNSDFSNDTPLAKLILTNSANNEKNKQLQQKEKVSENVDENSGGSNCSNKKDEPDNFESDSNDDKCLESIKREIRGLSGLKENSDNSSEETEKLNLSAALSINVDSIPPHDDSEQPTLIVEDSPNDVIENTAAPADDNDDVTEIQEEEHLIEDEQQKSQIVVESTSDQTVHLKVENSEQNEEIKIVENLIEEVENEEIPTIVVVEPPNIDDDIVEIKDDKSEDDKPDQIIIIEETDDAVSEETASDDVKIEIQSNDVADTAQTTSSIVSSVPSSVVKEQRISIDEEYFEDAKEHQNEDDDNKCTNIPSSSTIQSTVVDDEDTQQSDTKSIDNTITIIDTDEDTTIDTIKTEEKPKNKRDYSRRKQDLNITNMEKRQNDDQQTVQLQSTDDSKSLLAIATRMKLKERERSSSPYIDDDGNGTINDQPLRQRRRFSSTLLDSLPNSPASSDDREFKVWKKNILLVYSRLIAHKNSSLFTKLPTENEQLTSTNYKSIILRPIDLPTIKRNLDSGITRTTIEFQRDIMLMCYNVIMYNCDDKLLSNSMQLAKEFMNDALSFIKIIMMDTSKKDTDNLMPSSSSSSSSISNSGGGLKIVRGRKSPRLPVG